MSDGSKREILTERELIEQYGKRESDGSESKDTLSQKIRRKLRCDRRSVWRGIESVVPFIGWIRRYPLRKYLTGDISSGLTVGIVNLPQAMAYASLAAMPPINGLYTSFIPTLIYTLMGTSRHISIGTFALVSIMVGDSVSDRFPDDFCDGFNPNITATTGQFANMTSCDVYQMRERYAIVISLTMGFIFLAMYVLQLGFVTVYLSSHMISGFTCSSAVHVFTSQLAKLFGIKIPRQSGYATIIKTFMEVGYRFKEINFHTSTISVLVIIFLFLGKEINFRNRKRLPFALPWELVVVLVTTFASHFGEFNRKYEVDIVGDIPTGIRTTMPEFPLMGEVFMEAVSMVVVSYATAVSLAKMFAKNHGYEIRSNQELLAFSAIGLTGSFFGCIPAATSLSRSVIQEGSGCNTQITGAISASFILVVLLWIGPFFEPLPKAALAGIIVVNLKRLLKQWNQVPGLWRLSKIDACIWLITWLGVFILGVNLGLFVGVFVSILSITIRSQAARGEVLKPVSSKPIYRSSKKYNDDEENWGCRGDIREKFLIFSFASAIHFANKDSFKQQLFEALGFDPGKMKAQLAKQSEKELKKKNGGANKTSEKFAYVNKVVEAESDSQDSPSSSRGEVKVDLDTKPIQTVCRQASLAAVILDMKSCSFVDNDGCKTLKELHHDLVGLKIRLVFAECHADVYKTLLVSGFDDIVKKDEDLHLFFVSIQAAQKYEERRLAIAS